MGKRTPTLAAARWAAVASILLLAGCAQFSLPSLSMGQRSENQRELPAEEQTNTTGDSVAEAEPAPIPEPQEVAKPGKLYEWSGDGRSVSRVVINTNEQRARFYDGDEQIGWTTIASGVAKHPTPRGEFTILEKVKDKRSNLYGKIVNSKGGVINASATDKDRVPPGARFVGASMPNFMRMTYDGIGMHAGPIPRPGSPASHGCIRMPKQFAATVFNHISHGTAVTVIGNGPDYGNYGERIARQQAEERARRAAQAAAAAAEGPTLDALDAEVAVMKEAQPYTDATIGTSRGTTASRAGSTKSNNTSTIGTATAGTSDPPASDGPAETSPSDADSNATAIRTSTIGTRPSPSAPASETAPRVTTVGSGRSTDIRQQTTSTSTPSSQPATQSATQPSAMPTAKPATNPAPAMERPTIDAQAPTATPPPPSATRQPEPAQTTPPAPT